MRTETKTPYTLTIMDQPFRTICHSLGGIHKVIQVLDLLTPRTEFFCLHNPSSLRDKQLRDPDVKQYCMYPNELRKLSAFSRVWIKDFDKSEVIRSKIFLVSEFLDELEHVINHGVFVPENVYFQTMDRISLVRGDKKPGI